LDTFCGRKYGRLDVNENHEFTHISGHPSGVGRAPQDRECLPVKGQRSTTAPCNQRHPLVSDNVS